MTTPRQPPPLAVADQSRPYANQIIGSDDVVALIERLALRMGRSATILRVATSTFEAAPAPTPERTQGSAASLILTGVFAAVQIGKAIICMPDIREEMKLGLDVAGMIIAVFATLGALGGVGAGAVVARIGLRRSLIGGLAAIAAGNVLGAYAHDAETLLLARVLEGVGFFSVVLSVPSLLADLLNEANRDFGMAIWSAYMPAGIMLMLLIAPAVPVIGWRNLWLANGVLAGALAVYWCRSLRPVSQSDSASKDRRPVVSVQSVLEVLGEARCLAAAFAFFAYSFQIFSMALALPHYLASAYGIAIGTAGLLSGLAMAVSTAGHISSGYLLRARLRIWVCVATALLTFSVLSTFIYSTALSAPAVLVLAAISLGVGGFAPGALYASAPHVSPTPANIPTTIGLLQQASSLGQFAGPMMMGALAAHSGWPSVVFAVVPVALAGVLACLLLRRAESG